MITDYKKAKEKLLTDLDCNCQQFFVKKGYILENAYYELLSDNLEKSKNPDVRYYACVIDKNRAGAKPKLVFKLNLAYNSWEELGYLKLK